MVASRRFAGTPPSEGFSLLELLIVVAVIVAVAAIGIPVYRGYVATAHESALTSRMAAMAVFQEDTRLRTGAYGAGTFDRANGVDTLGAAIGWQPSAGDDTVYVVTADGAASWTVTARTGAGPALCRVFPANTACAP